MKTEFFDFIFNSSGKISSRRINKQYFINQNKEYLWDWFAQQQQIFVGYSNREIITLLKNDYTNPPKCIVCGKNSIVQMYSSIPIFKYCSKECSYNSIERKEKISKTKNLYTLEKKQSIEDKRKNTNLKKYGVKFQSQRPEVKSIVGEKLTKRYLSQDIINKLNDKNWLYQEYIIKNRCASDIANELNVYYGTVIEYCKKYEFKIQQNYQESLPQKQIYEFIKGFYKRQILYNDREILNGKELDIYIPELKFAIEYNGLFYHSFIDKSIENKNKHLNKTNLCHENGIRLLHVREDQWKYKQPIIKSMIKNIMGYTENRIYARQCIIKIPSLVETQKFLNNNHIQGFVGSSIKYGLYYNNELLSLISFGIPRNKNIKKKYSWELLRFCNKLNVVVIGGFSKLLKFFQTNYSGNIISYCDRSISNGNVYLKHNFIPLIPIEQIKPGYSWTNKEFVYSRESFQKHKLKNKLKIYDNNLSEFENMINNNYRILFDCGQIPFVLKKGSEDPF